MSFQKQGTPMPMKVASGMCEVCGQQPSVCLCQGKMMCQQCKEKATSSENA